MSALKHIGRIIFLYQTESDPMKKLLMELELKDLVKELERVQMR